MSGKNNIVDAYVRIILKHEGGYVNDPSDPGAETYCGISRKHHAGWGGWAVLDEKRHPIPTNSFFPELDKKVVEFYEENYIDSPMNVRAIMRLNVNLGIQVLDFGVNAGISRSAKLLQKILNVTQDGQVGPNTLAALERKNTDGVTSDFRDGRIAYYNFLASKHSWAKKFIHGWKKRVNESPSLLAKELA